MLEELYFGNLQPNGKIKTDGIYQNHMATLCECEEKLSVLLSTEEKEIFHSYVNAWSAVNATDTVENYILGFQMGARIVSECLQDTAYVQS